MGEVFNSFEELFASFVNFLPEFVSTLVVSVGCGLVIGLERESKGKPAGMRTLVLICLGSALFVQISVVVAGASGDHSRIAAQVVSGIGFLGAGAILHQSERGYIAGLTTAATIWVTAAIGMLVGAGRYVFAVLGVVFVIGALKFLRVLESKLFYDKNIEARTVYFDPEHGKTEWQLVGLLEDHLIPPSDYRFVPQTADDPPALEVRYCITNRNHRSFLSDVAEMESVLEIARSQSPEAAAAEHKAPSH